MLIELNLNEDTGERKTDKYTNPIFANVFYPFYDVNLCRRRHKDVGPLLCERRFATQTRWHSNDTRPVVVRFEGAGAMLAYKSFEHYLLSG